MKPSSQLPRTPSSLAKSCVFVFAAWLLLCGISGAAPSITLSAKSGPPTTRILVSGRGFEPNVGVDIYFGTHDEALIVTDGRGQFKNAGIRAPRSAPPGKHWVTALERNNDKGAQEPFLVQTDWSQFHFEADGSRLNPYENVLNPKDAGELGLKWSYNVGNLVYESSPAVVDGVLYIGAGSLYALDADTGAERWSYPLSNWAASPALENGIVYSNSQDGNIYALNARTGAKLWSSAIGSDDYSSPAVVDGVVYVGSGYPNNSLYALDARTGAKLWSYATGNTVDSSPTVVNGVVYFVSQDFNLYALDAKTGVKLWNYTIGSDVAVTNAPAVANGVVYVGTWIGNVYAINADTGTELWRFERCHSCALTSPAIANGVVYIGSEGGDVYALDGQTGELLWTYTTANVNSSPAVANGVVYVGSWGNGDYNFVYALNARTGAELWTYAVGYYVVSSPSVVNGTVYVGCWDDNVYAFSLQGHHEQTRQAPRPPDLTTLHPDLSLKVSNQSAAAQAP